MTQTAQITVGLRAQATQIPAACGIIMGGVGCATVGGCFEGAGAAFEDIILGGVG